MYQSIGSQGTVLIVEDDRNTAALVAAYLEREGFWTVVVHDGVEIGGLVIKCRQWGHEAAAIFGGKPVNPENAIPGGMSKPITPAERDRLEEIVVYMVEFGKFTLKVLHDQVLANSGYVDLILNGPYYHETYSMGLVDEKNRGLLGTTDRRFVSIDLLDLLVKFGPPANSVENRAVAVAQMPMYGAA